MSKKLSICTSSSASSFPSTVLVSDVGATALDINFNYIPSTVDSTRRLVPRDPLDLIFEHHTCSSGACSLEHLDDHVCSTSSEVEQQIAHLSAHRCEPCSRAHLDEHKCAPQPRPKAIVPCKLAHLKDHTCSCSQEHLINHTCECSLPHLADHTCKFPESHECPTIFALMTPQVTHDLVRLNGSRDQKKRSLTLGPNKTPFLFRTDGSSLVFLDGSVQTMIHEDAKVKPGEPMYLTIIL